MNTIEEETMEGNQESSYSECTVLVLALKTAIGWKDNELAEVIWVMLLRALYPFLTRKAYKFFGCYPEVVWRETGEGGYQGDNEPPPHIRKLVDLAFDHIGMKLYVGADHYNSKIASFEYWATGVAWKHWLTIKREQERELLGKQVKLTDEEVRQRGSVEDEVSPGATSPSPEELEESKREGKNRRRRARERVKRLVAKYPLLKLILEAVREKNLDASEIDKPRKIVKHLDGKVSREQLYKLKAKLKDSGRWSRF